MGGEGPVRLSPTHAEPHAPRVVPCAFERADTIVRRQASCGRGMGGGGEGARRARGEARHRAVAVHGSLELMRHRRLRSARTC